MNCFGKDKIAAIENVNIPIPQVEKTAVVTIAHCYEAYGNRTRDRLTMTGYRT
jgi:hypothetical protein